MRTPRAARSLLPWLLLLGPAQAQTGKLGVLPEATLTDPAAQLFGADVDLSGERCLVGAPYTDDPGTTNLGAAFVFARSGTDWSLEARLPAPAGSNVFGAAVALEGDVAVVYAWVTGIQVYTASGTAWSHAQTLPQPAGTSAFGDGLALSGGTLAVEGDPVSVFTFDGSGFALQQLLPRSSVRALAIDGDTIVLGQHWLTVAGKKEAGKAFVYRRAGTAWSQEAVLTAADATQYDHFGSEVAVRGDTIVVGAIQDVHNPGQGGNPSGEGSAYVFVRSGTTWSQDAKLTSFSQPDEQFGAALALLDGLVIVGEPGDDHSAVLDPGSVHFFVDTGAGWVEEPKLKQAPPGAWHGFGSALAADGDTLVVGAPYTNLIGAAEAYRLARPFHPVPYCTAGTTTNGCTALLSASGLASRSQAIGFDVAALGVEGQKQGLIYFGTTGPKATPWGAGTSWRCVQGPHTRTPAQGSGGTAGLCDGAFALDFNAWMAGSPALAPAAGDTVWMQAWFRDPPAPLTTSFSDALRFEVCP